jgi:transketolase
MHPTATVATLYAAAEADFAHYQKVLDVVDECLDLTLNYRQSGHPGGSHSKAHFVLSTLLSGAMRWDVRRPWLRFGDRFVLSAGHTVPLIYSALAVFNESLRARAERDGAAWAFPDGGKWALTWEDLLGFRHRHGLPGHAETSGKTMFFKANTGPSGHGMPSAAGQALALKMAGAEQVKVFVVEGEGGLTPGATHETLNSAWGLGLSNLVFLVDWNDYGIDLRAHSSVVYGTPQDWFGAHGWRVVGTEQGMDWGPVTRTVLDATRGENAAKVPTAAWFKTRKGARYGKFDAPSHGTPLGLNAAAFWDVRKGFMDKYGVAYEGFGADAPADSKARQAQNEANLRIAISVLRNDAALVTWLSDRLEAIAQTVPTQIDGMRLGSAQTAALFADPRITDYKSYPEGVWKKPGDKQPNRAGLGVWGAYVNAIAKKDYGRPLVVASSADLAESTNIAGFAKDFGDLKGFGLYERDGNPGGTLLPQEITEFTNAGIMAGMASVNFAENPFTGYDGFWGATSTYASFSYLLYGPLRLYSQLAQDTDTRVGKVIWVAGHSGPETAEDSRTHFGIFETQVTQLFPEGAVIDLHPWEYNEVPVMLGAALATEVPIVALHVTRPAVPIPDRAALGMPSHFDAAKGAYVLRAYKPGLPKMGVVVVRGTVTTANLVSVLGELDKAGLNVKIVAALSPQLFARQDAAYRDAVLSEAERFDAMAITNGAFKALADWVKGPLAREYSLSADADDRWRTGGSVDEVYDEAGLSKPHILAAIERFAKEREVRLAALRATLAATTA